MVQRYAHLAPDHLSSYANNLERIVTLSVASDNVTIVSQINNFPVE